MTTTRGLTTEEMVKVVLQHQVDAVTRTIFLLAEAGVTFEDIIRKLAESEEKANFVCGFVELEKAEKEKQILKRYLVDHGFVTVNEEGLISLTAKGEERAKTELPQQIEQALVD
ncbi:MAG: hypothetical protein HYW90_02500 [Candidatus Sungbacteria bacterium]|nr:hypothetical protein [Candidatus Sungbacteria bacterium]